MCYIPNGPTEKKSKVWEQNWKDGELEEKLMADRFVWWPLPVGTIKINSKEIYLGNRLFETTNGLKEQFAALGKA